MIQFDVVKCVFKLYLWVKVTFFDNIYLPTPEFVQHF